MTIEDSERYLRLMLGGMKYAVEYWKDRDKEESDIEQINVEVVETALDTMRKYQKITEIVKAWREVGLDYDSCDAMENIEKVLEDANNKQAN